MPKMLRRSSHNITAGGGMSSSEYLVNVKPLKVSLNNAMKPKKGKKKSTPPYKRVVDKRHPDVTTKGRPQAPR